MTLRRPGQHRQLLLAIIDTDDWPRSMMWHALAVPQDLATAAAGYRAAQQAVDDAKTAVRESQAQLRQARAELTQTIVAEANAGTRMRDLVKATGLSREWIRTLLRQNGVYPNE